MANAKEFCMTREEKIRAIEEVMELDEGILKEDSILCDFEEWDSMTKLALIAESQKIFDKNLTGTMVKECKTVADLLSL